MHKFDYDTIYTIRYTDFFIFFYRTCSIPTLWYEHLGYIHIHTCTYKHTYIHVHTMYIHTYIHTCTYIHTYIHTHTHTHTHTHIHTNKHKTHDNSWWTSEQSCLLRYGRNLHCLHFFTSYSINNHEQNTPSTSILDAHHNSSVESQKGVIHIQVFFWEPEGRYLCTMSMAISPFWFSMEERWIVITPFCFSADESYHV